MLKWIIECPIDELYTVEELEEELQLLRKILEEENQTKRIANKPPKRAKEPTIIYNLCGAKYEIQE